MSFPRPKLVFVSNKVDLVYYPNLHNINKASVVVGYQTSALCPTSTNGETPSPPTGKPPTLPIFRSLLIPSDSWSRIWNWLLKPSISDQPSEGRQRERILTNRSSVCGRSMGVATAATAASVTSCQPPVFAWFFDNITLGQAYKVS